MDKINKMMMDEIFSKAAVFMGNRDAITLSTVENMLGPVVLSRMTGIPGKDYNEYVISDKYHVKYLTKSGFARAITLANAISIIKDEQGITIPVKLSDAEEEVTSNKG